MRLKLQTSPFGYMVVCDCEIMWTGSKKECRSYYKSLPSPMPMKLYKIENEWDLR